MRHNLGGSPSWPSCFLFVLRDLKKYGQRAQRPDSYRDTKFTKKHKELDTQLSNPPVSLKSDTAKHL